MAKAVMFTLISLAVTIVLFMFEAQISGFLMGFAYDLGGKGLGLAVMDPAEIAMFSDLFSGLKYLAGLSTILGVLTIIFGKKKEKKK